MLPPTRIPPNSLAGMLQNMILIVVVVVVVVAFVVVVWQSTIEDGDGELRRTNSGRKPERSLQSRPGYIFIVLLLVFLVMLRRCGRGQREHGQRRSFSVLSTSTSVRLPLA